MVADVDPSIFRTDVRDALAVPDAIAEAIRSFDDSAPRRAPLFLIPEREYLALTGLDREHIDQKIEEGRIQVVSGAPLPTRG